MPALPFFMIELNDFYNDGFGWACRHCEREILASLPEPERSHSRLLTEGEGEVDGDGPRLSHQTLAKWADAARRTLVCPRCGITELADLA